MLVVQVAFALTTNVVDVDLAHKASCVLNLLGSTLKKATTDSDDETWRTDQDWIMACNLSL